MSPFVLLGRSPLGFLLMTLAGASAVVGFGIMIAALVRTEGQVDQRCQVVSNRSPSF